MTDTTEIAPRALDSMREKVRAAGVRMIGPNCMGVINTDAAVSLNATSAPTPARPGSIGFVSQSGALADEFYETAKTKPDLPPVYRFPESAARALFMLARYGAWRRPDEAPVAAFTADDQAVEEILARTAEGYLGPADVFRVLDLYGIPLARWQAVATPEEALAAARQIGYPVVLKAIAPRLQAPRRSARRARRRSGRPRRHPPPSRPTRRAPSARPRARHQPFPGRPGPPDRPRPGRPPAGRPGGGGDGGAGVRNLLGVWR
jgi:acyl-CoA synthetase (NDP forming)